MQIDYPQFIPYAIALLAVLLVFRRLRRSFGPQPLRPVRMRIRIGILVFLGLSLVPGAMRSPQFLPADLAGLVAGIALGLWAARRTRYDKRDSQMYYIPHTYSGVAISLLFVGRLVYRMVVLYSMNRAAGTAAGAATLQQLASPIVLSSPLTLGLLCVVIGYYVCYYSLVLRKARRIGPEDLEISATPIVSSGR